MLWAAGARPQVNRDLLDWVIARMGEDFFLERFR